MAVDFPFKSRYGFADLVGIMAILRSEGGCPWDREQDHHSIRPNLIEETYEAVEAIDTDDPGLLQEELGDVLLQVVFHSRIEEEAGGFSIDDVVDGICRKLIVRHPHVFGTARADTSADVLKSWNDIKKRTKGQHSEAEGMADIPRVLPALMRSRKVLQKAAQAGLQPPGVPQAAEKIRGALERAETAAGQDDSAAGARAAGELLFAAVALAAALHTEPEEALTACCDRFVARFTRAERMAAASGRPLKDMPPVQLQQLWERAGDVL